MKTAEEIIHQQLEIAAGRAKRDPATEARERAAVEKWWASLTPEKQAEFTARVRKAGRVAP